MRISDWSSDVCSSDLAFEEAIVGLCNFDTDKDRDRAKEAVGIARLRLTTSTAKPNPDIVYVLEHEVDGDGREVIAVYKSHDAAIDDIVKVTENDARKACLQIENRSEEHKSELQSLMRISYAVFCLKHIYPIKRDI